MTAPTPRLLPIEELNRQPLAAFVEGLRPLFEAAGPLAERLAAGRPYASYGGLLTRADVLVDELSPEDKLAVGRARKIQRFLSQPFHVAEVFTGSPGKYVTLKDTIKGFKMIVNGECDSLPEQAFYMVGTIEEAFEKAKTLQ